MSRLDIENHEFEPLFSDNEIQIFNIIEIVFETFFLIETIQGFLLEYTPHDSIYKVRKIKKIAWKYLNTNFIFDFLPLIPFRFIFDFKYSRLFYLIKCMRLEQFFDVLDTSNFMRMVKSFYRKRAQYHIDKN